MKRLRIVLMATAAMIVSSAIATTAAQATESALGIAPASTAWTSGAQKITAPAIQTTALQVRSFQDTTQFEIAAQTVVNTEKVRVGDTKKATTGGLWAAIIPSTVGFYGKQAQVRDFDLKGVAVIDRAQQPATVRVYKKLHSLGAGIG